MNLGIDIDGVLTDVRKFTIEEGLKYCKQHKKGELVNPAAYDSSNVFSWDEKTDLDFWKKNIFIYAEKIHHLSEQVKTLKS